MESELSVREELQGLEELQELDTKLQKLTGELEALPSQLVELETDLDANKVLLQKAQALVEKSQQDQRESEEALATLREQLVKYKVQLMEVKTNKEYQAVLKEISLTEQGISTTEDNILELMLDADDILQESKQFEMEFHEKNREVQGRIQAAQNSADDAEKLLEKSKESRLELVTTVSPESLSHYERISKARGGLGLAKIMDGSCQGCNVRLRPQLVAEIRAAIRIGVCEKCQRFLYFETLET